MQSGLLACCQHNHNNSSHSSTLRELQFKVFQSYHGVAAVLQEDLPLGRQVPAQDHQGPPTAEVQDNKQLAAHSSRVAQQA